MEYDVVSTEDVPRVDLGETVDEMFEPEVRRVQAELGTEKMVSSVWYFEEGDSMLHHVHEEQEELYYVLEGEFELKLGEVGDTETETVEKGDFFAVGPDIGHGHKCLSEEGGSILAVGAPNVTDVNPESYTPYDKA